MKTKLYLIALIFLAMAANGTKLIFSNNGEEVDIVGSAQINMNTGDVTVTTNGDYLIEEDIAKPVILGFYPNDYDIATGSNITVNWTVSNAASCSASVSQGSAGWTGTKTSTDGSWQQSNVSVSTMPATLVLSCVNQNGDNQTKSFQVVEQTGGGTVTNPTFNYLRVNSQSPAATVTPPGTATISWSTTDITTNCTASANPAVTGWSGTKNPNGSQQVTFSQDTTVTLVCGGITRNVSVTYEENSSCSSSVYPPGLTRVNGLYETINDGFEFGESTNTSFLLEIKTDSFVTLSNFSYPVNDSRRRIVFVDAPTSQNLMEKGTISVSECPGDFTNSAACVIEVTNSKTIFVTTKASDGNTDPFCKIDPNKTYYINYIMTHSPYNVPPYCRNSSHNRCSMFYSESL